MLVGQLSLLLIYLLDATVMVWRRGDRRQALLVCGSIVVFAVLGTAQAILAFWGFVPMPITTSLFFVGIIAAMGFELSRDMVRVAEVSADLEESEHRMTLAAEAANLGIWIRDLTKDEIWATEKWRSLFGFSRTEHLDFEKMLQHLHPDDREMMRGVFLKAQSGNDAYEREFRIGPN
jgi:PAS domain-containing protein